jgi:hypothetical protein
MNKFKEGMFREGYLVGIVSIDGGRWHMSISTNHRLPTYEELKSARYKYLPDDITMAQLFPPKAEFVNIHNYTLHLWEIKTQD